MPISSVYRYRCVVQVQGQYYCYRPNQTERRECYLKVETTKLCQQHNNFMFYCVKLQDLQQLAV